MIAYKKFKLDNGLTVIHHQDKTTPMVVVNVIYDVGAKDENEAQTGFAHLFEHLMFGGSKNIESFDAPLQLAGGECNAFTSNDVTNYYNILPSQNIETAFWLESDRMLELAFTEKSLEVQRNVVIEEFKQRYLNQPYGDVWLKLRPIIYKTHPYKWATIGKELKHIEDAKLQDVQDFFYKHYNPQNAVLVVGGNVDYETVQSLTKKWFAPIPARTKYIRNIPLEPVQTEERREVIVRDVPSNAIYMAFRMGGRKTDDHYIGDLCSDMLSGSKSSRLYSSLIVEKKLFSTIGAFITGAIEDGLFVISGNLQEDVTFEDAEKNIWLELEKLKTVKMDQSELTKIKNKHKTSKVFAEQSILARVLNIAFFEVIEMLPEIDDELLKYDRISAEAIKSFALQTFKQRMQSVLHVKKAI